MSINNFITKLLNMEEKNLIFCDDFYEERIIKDKRCLIIKGYLKNELKYCPKCGCINNNTIIKKGTEKSLIKINKISEINSYLELYKQVYKCKCCNRKTVSKSNIVDFGCYISNNLKMAVFRCAKEIMAKSTIARLYNISDNTVQKIFDTQFHHDTVYKNYIPEAICIDEFTYKRKTFAFNICDAKTGKTVDLVEDRTTYNLNKYFSHYTYNARKEVKFVVMDMYSPYIDLTKKWFSNSKIIIDLFHIVQLLSKSLNQTRINVMKEHKEDINKFKNYKKLLLKSRFDIDNNSWKKFRCFKELMTELDVVDYLLSKSIILENSYMLYQDILYYLQHRNYDGFNQVINKNHENISKEMKTTINT